MAKYVFDARKYPVGTLLSDLGWFVSDAGDDFIVVDPATGDFYWRATTVAAISIMTSPTLHTAYEILLLRYNELDDYRSSGAQLIFHHGFRFHPLQTVIGGTITSADYLHGYYHTGGSESYAEVGGMTITASSTPIMAKTIPMAARFQVHADGTYKYKNWGQAYAFPAESLEVQEPNSDWTFQGSTGVAAGTAFAIPTPSNFGTDSRDGAMFNVISIGTDGDIAEYPDEALVLTEPTVSVSDVTGTTATVNWS